MEGIGIVITARRGAPSRDVSDGDPEACAAQRLYFGLSEAPGRPLSSGPFTALAGVSGAEAPEHSLQRRNDSNARWVCWEGI